MFIKLITVAVLSHLQESTMYYTTCGYCNKSMERGGWQCHRCDKLTSWCSVW